MKGGLERAVLVVTSLLSLHALAAESVAFTGKPFNCASWVENAGASVTLPSLNLDLFVSQLRQAFDVGLVLRLNDD